MKNLHAVDGSDLDALRKLLDDVDAAGEEFDGQPFQAGQGWAVVTKKRAPRKPSAR